MITSRSALLDFKPEAERCFDSVARRGVLWHLANDSNEFMEYLNIRLGGFWSICLGNCSRSKVCVKRLVVPHAAPFEPLGS